MWVSLATCSRESQESTKSAAEKNRRWFTFRGLESLRIIVLSWCLVRVSVKLRLKRKTSDSIVYSEDIKHSTSHKQLAYFMPHSKVQLLNNPGLLLWMCYFQLKTPHSVKTQSSSSTNIITANIYCILPLKPLNLILCDIHMWQSSTESCR